MRTIFLAFLLIALNSFSLETLENELNSNSDEEDLFVPTHEWQVVKKGQKIPKGLHIRVNFETGTTEAKILDENEGKEKTRAVAEVPSVGAQNSNEDDEGSLKYSEAELKKVLKNLKDDAPEEKVDNKFRSYEELKKELEDLNLAPKTDVELLDQLIAEHQRIYTENEEDTRIVSILEDLEYLVHQYDNANEFVRLNGFREVVFKDLNSSNTDIKKEALKLLGSSLQNNAKVQIHALEEGSLNILLRTIALDSNDDVKSRGIFALSSLLRRFPLAQLKFTENAGLSIFTKILNSKVNIKAQLKIITVVNDLIVEHKHVLEDYGSVNYDEKVRQYNQINLKQKLKEHDWCEVLNDLLVHVLHIDQNDHDAIEKCLIAINSMLDVCSKNTLNNIQNLVRNVQEVYSQITADRRNTGDVEGLDYYIYLHLLCEQISRYKPSYFKVEL